MSIHLSPILERNFFEVKLSDTLARADYEKLGPEVDRWIAEHGKIRMLVVMQDFHGWHAGGIWEDLKFDVRHYSDFERIALVGEKQWQRYMSACCTPFVKAELRYFDLEDLEKAKSWLES